jgi:hypothetical protein
MLVDFYLDLPYDKNAVRDNLESGIKSGKISYKEYEACDTSARWLWRSTLVSIPLPTEERNPRRWLMFQYCIGWHWYLNCNGDYSNQPIRSRRREAISTSCKCASARCARSWERYTRCWLCDRAEIQEGGAVGTCKLVSRQNVSGRGYLKAIESGTHLKTLNCGAGCISQAHEQIQSQIEG